MKRKKSSRRSSRPVILVILLIMLVGIAGLASMLISRNRPSRELMDLQKYYSNDAGGPVAEGQAAVILGTEIQTERAIASGETWYLPLSMVNTGINKRFYWDGEGNQILYATPSELVYTPAQGEPGGDVWIRDGIVYLSIPFIERFTDMDVYTGTNPSRIAIQSQFSGYKVVTVKKNSAVRHRGGIKAPILRNVSSGEELILLEELEDWDQVATKDGFIGYIEKKAVSGPQEMAADRPDQKEQYTYLTLDEKVNLVWHQVTNQGANAYFDQDTANMTGVNVISPTWYSIADNSGNITDLSSSSYVEEAHDRGLQVWGLVDNFSASINSTTILSSTAARQNLISQLVSSAVSTGQDGINIDLETLQEEAGVHFLEFLREMSIECHKNHLILSVDNPVPKDFTSHYDRKEQGLVVDYVIMMGYDEHYPGSAEAGSGASLPWVEEGVQDTVAEVDPSRVILGIPFYSLAWKTLSGRLTLEQIGMGTMKKVISENNAQTWWDNNISQNVAVYERDGASFKIWAEDESSLSMKVSLVSKYQLGGTAAWKLGLEESSIWQVISDNL